MNTKTLALMVLALVFTNACSTNPLAGPQRIPASAKQTQSFGNYSTADSASSSAADDLLSPAPQTNLDKAASAFSGLKSFRMVEKLEPVSGSKSTYEIEIVAPDRERVISRGDCPYNQRGESIAFGDTLFSRCGAEPWKQTKQARIGSHKAYLDYMQNGSAFAVKSHEANNLWEITADYHGSQVPPGTMIWFIGREDFLPRKLIFMIPGRYPLISEFRDFDSPAIRISVPTTR